MRAFIFALLLALPRLAGAEGWQAGINGENHFASARGTEGTQAIVSFRKGRSKALVFITGLWQAQPLMLRLRVRYAGGRNVPIDTYRHAEIIRLNGTRAYKLEVSRAALRPLKGGDTLIVEDLTRRAEIPLTGSSKAIKAAEAGATE